MATMAFDANYYLAQYQDVREAVAAGKITAEQHWKLYGWKEERNPNAEFNTAYYAAHNTDVVTSGMNYLDHYLQYGSAEAAAGKRLPNAAWESIDLTKFDKVAYLAANQDVKAAGMDALQHYMLYGRFEASRDGTAKLMDGTVVTAPKVTTLGETFTLTTSVDNVVGTSGNDTIIGDNTGTATSSVADQVNGGAGTDTFKLYTAAADLGAAIGLPQLTSVENLYINGGTFKDASTFDASSLTGVTSVAFEGQVALVDGKTFTVKTAAGQDVSVKKVYQADDNAAKNSTLVLDGASKITVDTVGATNAGTVTVDVKPNSVKTFDVVTTGSGTTGASKLILTNTGNAVAALNVSGAGDVTITETLAGLKTINASAATGKVTIDQSGRAAANVTVDFAFTGGSGNDTLKLSDDTLGRLTLGSQLDGGAGTGDKIGILDTILSAPELTALNAAKNFEVLGLNAAINIDASKITSIKEFSVDTADKAITISNMATGSKVTAAVDSNTTLNLSAATGVSDLSLTLGSATTTDIDLASVTLGQTSVALASLGKGTATNTITTLVNADNSNIVVTGNNDLTITNALAATAVGSKVDATALTGKLNVTGSLLSDVLIGGSANDTLNGGKITEASATAKAEVFTVKVTGKSTQAGDVIFNGTKIALAGDEADAAAVATKIAAGNFNDWTVTSKDDVLTFTARSTGFKTDVVTKDFDLGATKATIDAPTVTTQGTPVVAQSLDTLTGNGGADTFVFSSPDRDIAAANGSVTTVITDFVTGVDKIKDTVVNAAGSATNYLEATSVAATLANLLTAADNALTGDIKYYVGQVGSDSYLVTDSDGMGMTNVIKLTGVALDKIAYTDLVA